ncbi:HMG-Y-related protein A-like [Dorcoceras hygrometricum]|uniref:HMG-Y-related protein A n=1 Tax=Dorcoceras hygrometricum TaxID=472368 RepID=A0A2Z7ACR1_9LAMI|nr:HMG-Y-related protein A-like [Dorcoceras hygrometricum]
MAAEEQQSFNPQFAAQPQPQPPTQVFPPMLPQYPEMILTAIEELNEKNGSNKTSISKHIESTYGNLPPAHSTLLTHHLNRMKSSGQLVFFKNNYLKPDPNSPPRRGRGRPPKPKAPIPPGTVLPPPRPRGRPPKSRDPSDPPPPPKPKPASGATSVSGKKRGRPPKVAAEQVPIDTLPPSTSTTGGAPRGRGKPPKDAAEQVPTDAPAPSTTGGAPRGRGRPPKVKPAVATPVGA